MPALLAACWLTVPVFATDSFSGRHARSIGRCLRVRFSRGLHKRASSMCHARVSEALLVLAPDGDRMVLVALPLSRPG